MSRPARTWSNPPTGIPSRSSREAGQDHRATGVECRQGRGPVPGREGQPAVGEQVRADHRGRVHPLAAHRNREEPDRAEPDHARHGSKVGQLRLVDGDRPDRGEKRVAGDDVAEPRGGRSAGRRRDAPERDEDGQRHGQAADRQRGAAPVTDQRTAVQALLRGQERPGDRTEQRSQRTDQERARQRHAEQQPEDGKRPDDPGRSGRRARPEREPGETDDREHERQPAEAGPQDGRLFEPGR